MRKKIDVKSIEYNPACDPKSAHGYSNVRWVENASCGLRLVGFADEIEYIDHKGWFTMDDGLDGEVYRGIVYQLPARRGVEQFAYGYADSMNEGAALLCFDVVSDKSEAAHQADRFAEIFAEAARDFYRASDAGRRYRDLADEIKEYRTKALTIGAEMRAVKAAADVRLRAPTLCATLRKEILSLYRRIQKAREERAKLLDDFGNCDGFAE